MAWLQTASDSTASTEDTSSTTTSQSMLLLHPQSSVALTWMAYEPSVGHKHTQYSRISWNGGFVNGPFHSHRKCSGHHIYLQINTESAHTSSAEIAESSGLA